MITTANDPRLAKTDPTLDDWFVFRDSCRAALLAKEEAEGQAKRLEAAVGWALENGEEINTFYGRSTWKRELRRRCAKEG